MRFMVTADTDVGIEKHINQDSIIVKHGTCEKGEVLMAIVCDGMGGLTKGELASATAVRVFAEWFDKELPYELENFDAEVVSEKWGLLLKDVNEKILEYSQRRNLEMGTTFTGMLFVDNQYIITHVGDTRAYHIDSKIEQLTTDHTFVAREMGRGTMTLSEAKIDQRRNALLQCVGDSQEIDPEILVGTCEKGIYMLCSDGFRHEITQNQIQEAFNVDFADEKAMHDQVRGLIELVKQNQETDNISVILIKAE